MGDAAVRTAQERRRAEGDQHADVIARQLKAIDAALDLFEKEDLSGWGIGEIAIAAHLGYLDSARWSTGAPAVPGWRPGTRKASKRDSMVASEPYQIA